MQHVKPSNSELMAEKIEMFMQNVLLLVDSQPKLTKIILQILAKLATIQVDYDFSKYCFNTLKDLIRASKDMKSTVMDTLEHEVIKKLNNISADTISISLMEGLCSLVRESEKAEQVTMLTHLFQNGFFKKFLDEFSRLQNRIGFGEASAKSQKSRFYDQVFALLATALTNERNIEEAEKIGVH